MYENLQSLLGYLARDKITGFEGAIVAVCFELNGTVSLALANSKCHDNFSMNRIKICGGKVAEAKRFDIWYLEDEAKKMLATSLPQPTESEDPGA